MNPKNILRSIACLATIAMITACGSSGGNSSKPTAAGPTMADFDQKLYVSGGTYDQFQVVNIDPSAMTITITIPLPASPVSGESNVPVSQIPGATITVAQSQIGRFWIAALTLPLKDLFSGINYENQTTLPSGNALPGNLGNTPMLELNVFVDFKTNLHFYLYGSQSVIAIFYPLPDFNNSGNVTFQVANKTNDVHGYLGLIPQVTKGTATFPGGIFGAYLIPWQLQQIITGSHNNNLR
jgi:hypothetical protein